MNLFFLAAGLGTRLRPLTNKYPKPCVPFLNVPMGLYQFRFLNGLNISSCVANSFHLPEQVAQLYSHQKYINVPVTISTETGSILGSAGGLKKASQYFDRATDTILMMNADEIFFTKKHDFLNEAYEQHTKNKNLATLIVMKHPEAGQKFGAIWCNSQNKVQTIMQASKKPQGDLTPFHYIGVMFLHKKVLDLIPSNKETNIFYDILINELQNNSVEIYNLDCDWYETGNAKDYLEATQKVLSSLDSHTHSFINTYDKSRLVKNASGISLISESLQIDEKRLSGFNVLAKKTNLSKLDTEKIENSVLFESEVLNLGYFS